MAEVEDQRHRLESFGEQAARVPDVDALLQRACEEIAEALRVSQVKAMEYLPEQNALLIRAGVGWAEGVVGHVVLGADTAPGLTLASGQPVISHDLSREDRFRVPRVLLDHGVKSSANVLIRMGDSIFGVLEADHDQRRNFSARDTELLQGFANVLALVIAQARLAVENRALSEKKELLLRELVHRTKNNNQMLLSMVYLHRMKTMSPEAQKVLETFENRVQLFSSIDEMLSLDGEKESIDAPQFIGAITGKVFAAVVGKQRSVRLLMELEDGVLSRRQAQALAVIINEFITNSCKHAFSDRGGRLSVKTSFRPGSAVVELADDGAGLPARAVPGLGMQIIGSMARQMQAEARWASAEGTVLRLTIPQQP